MLNAILQYWLSPFGDTAIFLMDFKKNGLSNILMLVKLAERTILLVSIYRFFYF